MVVHKEHNIDLEPTKGKLGELFIVKVHKDFDFSENYVVNAKDASSALDIVSKNLGNRDNNYIVNRANNNEVWTDE